MEKSVCARDEIGDDVDADGAIVKTKAPKRMTAVLSVFSISLTGSVIASPNTTMLADVTVTATMANITKLTGSPKKLPAGDRLSFGARLPKSAEIDQEVAKNDTYRQWRRTSS